MLSIFLCLLAICMSSLVNSFNFRIHLLKTKMVSLMPVFGSFLTPYVTPPHPHVTVCLQTALKAGLPLPGTHSGLLRSFAPY